MFILGSPMSSSSNEKSSRAEIIFIMYVACVLFRSRKRDTRERDGTEKQWTEIETETKTVDNDMTRKNGEERSSTTTTSSTDDSLPKINPVKWTVISCISCIYTYI